ncbi:hypothetical protein M9H77_16729 [Catharanthus roseus]|uniref:Uncharacterized protein n=1 Tax=Catharanthus roseus TaxID=4058 RepID=A0ACC0B2M6_CATRO|nr:hypothetical protein M9H77_16729 [Catharanthus roseus]
MKISFRPGLKFGENQVNGRIRGLHCTWLVPRTRASSNDVGRFLTVRVDPLNEGCSTGRAWPNRLTQDGQRYNRLLKFYAWDFGLSLSERTYIFVLLPCTRAVCKCREARRYSTQPQLT